MALVYGVHHKGFDCQTASESALGEIPSAVQNAQLPCMFHRHLTGRYEILIR